MKKRDHPRVCGEKVFACSGRAFNQGSPPRMRGKGLKLILCVFRAGITPAYAGKSLPAFLKKWAKKDHPRVCGEKLFFIVSWYLRLGSPPRMRGKGSFGHCLASSSRITPAYAGKSSFGVSFGVSFGASFCRITPAYAGKRLKRSRSTVSPVAIVPLFPSVCNKPVVSDGSPAVRDAPLFLPAENAVPASPACNLRSL